MRNFQCEACRHIIEIETSVNGVMQCTNCGRINSVPRLETLPEAFAAILNGNIALSACKFEDAKAAFREAIKFDDMEPSAYFNLALATFKVQYLWDEANKRYQPICYEISNKKFTDDTNYLKAIIHATSKQKALYQQRGNEIDKIREEFFHLQESGLDYDCFLCVKISEDNKMKTQDSVTAHHIHDYLLRRGYKPFYSERDIHNRTGSDYEAMILYALYKSECMLIVCSNEDYLETQYVRNEYLRFIKMVDNDAKERDAITFVFDGKPIDCLPNGKRIQGIDIQSQDAYPMIADFVDKHTPESKQKREVERNKAFLEEETVRRQFDEQNKKLEKMQLILDAVITKSEPAVDRFATQNQQPIVQSAIVQTAGHGKIAEVQNTEEESNSNVLRYEKRKTSKTKRAEALRSKADQICNSAKNLYSQGKCRQALALFRQAAKLDLADAQSFLGCFYANGDVVQQNHKKAFFWFTKAAKQGHAFAQFALGNCYHNGEGVSQDDTKAVSWYVKAAEQGDVDAQAALGLCYYYGEGVSQDYVKAVSWYAKAAEQGDVDTQYNLGMCYFHGYGLLQDYAKAVSWFTKAAEQGDAGAQFSLGVCYANEQGVPQDYGKAVYWYTKSAEQGNADAQFNLGLCYANGQGVPQDYEKAVYWYTKAAEQSDIAAQNNLAGCYLQGQGVPQDYKKAVFWYTKSAEQDDAGAQYALGACYENGYGVSQDYEKAVYWYTKAAEQGDADAQCQLGLFYTQGDGVSQDYNKAFNWFGKAAEQGDANGQYLLGLCYSWGMGVSKNNDKAIFWYTKAAAQGHEEAKKKLGR